MVHFHTIYQEIAFEVFPGYPHEECVDNWIYISKENEPDELMAFEDGKCLVKMKGSCRWRGVWDERLYFPDEEYWGRDLAELSALYTNLILPYCKDYIKQINPGDFYDD